MEAEAEAVPEAAADPTHLRVEEEEGVVARSHTMDHLRCIPLPPTAPVSVSLLLFFACGQFRSFPAYSRQLIPIPALIDQKWSYSDLSAYLGFILSIFRQPDHRIGLCPHHLILPWKKIAAVELTHHELANGKGFPQWE